MIHRTAFGSLERFIGILIEHYAGAFPFWLAPVQVSLIPVAEAHEAHAKGIQKKMQEAGLRVETKPSSDTLGSRIRQAQTEKIPYMIVLGDKEIQADKIAVRSRTKGDLGQTALLEFLAKAKEEVEKRGVTEQ